MNEVPVIEVLARISHTGLFLDSNGAVRG